MRENEAFRTPHTSHRQASTSHLKFSTYRVICMKATKVFPLTSPSSKAVLTILYVLHAFHHKRESSVKSWQINNGSTGTECVIDGNTALIIP